MVRAVSVAGASGPNSSPCKDRHKDQKKDAGHFEPENAAHAAEGTQKAAHAAAHGMTGVAHRLRSLHRGVDCGLAGGAVLVVGTLGLGAGNRSRLMQVGNGSR